MRELSVHFCPMLCGAHRVFLPTADHLAQPTRLPRLQGHQTQSRCSPASHEDVFPWANPHLEHEQVSPARLYFFDCFDKVGHISKHLRLNRWHLPAVAIPAPRGFGRSSNLAQQLCRDQTKRLCQRKPKQHHKQVAIQQAHRQCSGARTLEAKVRPSQSQKQERLC